MRRDTRLRWRLFLNLFPWNWRCAPASSRQGTEPSLCFECGRFNDRRSGSGSGPYGGIHGSKCEGVSIVARGMHKAGRVIVVRVTDNGGDRGPSIGVQGKNELSWPP